MVDVYRKRFGHKQESGLLEFKDWIEISLVDFSGNPVPDEDYNLYLPDGSEKSGKLDSEGLATVKDVPPGKFHVKFPGVATIYPEEEGEQYPPGR